MNTIESTNSTHAQSKSPDQTGNTRSIASGCLNTNTNTTYIGSTDEPLNKKYIEHLFLEESKNRINDYYNTNKFGAYITEKYTKPSYLLLTISTVNFYYSSCER